MNSCLVYRTTPNLKKKPTQNIILNVGYSLTAWYNRWLIPWQHTHIQVYQKKLLQAEYRGWRSSSVDGMLA